jgi:DNA-binding ferritin-like protein (Dps family)
MLKLQASQDAAWTRYSEAIDVYNKTYYEEKPIAAYATDAGPRQVGRLVDILQNRLAALDEIESAAKNLYEVLNADQKKVADQLMVASVPVFASVGGAMCPDPSEKKAKSDKPAGAQRSRHSGGASSGASGGSMLPTGAWNN